MKSIRIVELLAEIKANLVAFLSISLFVSLGIGLFLGIHWGAAALRDASLEAMDEGNMHDISIQFPYGITADDLKELKKIDGVTEVECGYSSYSVMKDGSAGYVLKMQSLPNAINKPISIVGNLPMEADEAALLEFWAKDHGIKVGDTIKLRHDATNADDKDGMEYLTSDTYTVTALVDTPEYLFRDSSSLGVSGIGSGDIDCVAFVTTDSFDKDKFHDGYPNVYIRCNAMDGISVYSDDYVNGIGPIVDRVNELGRKLGTARYKSIRDEAELKLDDAKNKIADGEKALADGQKQISDGEKQLAEGQKKLDEGEKELLDSVVTGTGEQTAAQIALSEAYRELSNGQALYDAGMRTYNDAMDIYAQLSSSFGDIRGDYDLFVSLVYELQSLLDSLGPKTDSLDSATQRYQDDPSPENWSEVTNAFNDVSGDANALSSVLDRLSSSGNSVGNTLGMFPSLSGSENGVPSTITPDTARSSVDSSKSLTEDARNELNKIENTSITVSGITIYLMDIPGGLDLIYDGLVSSKTDLDAAKAELDRGWNEYYAAKAEYDYGVAAGQAKLQSAERELEDGKATLADKSRELEDGKATLADKSKELEDGKATLADAQEQFDSMIEYEWVVMPRQGNGGVQGLKMVSTMMDNVKWAMALLFILVGLFVCYSAISRLVHEEIIQIGTKKSLGFRTGEAMSMYLFFSGLAVLLGIIASIAIAILLVQGIMNPKAYKQFCIPPYGPNFSIVDTLVMGGIELALILASTWFAIHGLLKRNAIDLLRGESTANVKEHFYEYWGVWQRMSLFSQTVVNNCVNDTRRVIGTLVGVIGCTALIVTAVTLSLDIADSLIKHYKDVYHFNAITYMDEESQEKADGLALALYNRGVSSAPAFSQKLQVRMDDGTRNMVTLVVPTNEDSFKKLYSVWSISGEEAEIQNGGLWISTAYANHQGVSVGDNITLTEFSGQTKTFKVAGIFEYYLIRYEFVLSPNEYREAFGNKPQPNVLLTDLGDGDIDRTRDALSEIDGYNTLVDDKAIASYSYDEINDILRTVVLIYLVLSAIMALMVLLNLDIMFVEEKKKELIVLMICGFSTKDAKAYIYRDSIVLTIIGIILGVLLGAIMGGITIAALEPAMAYWLKGFNWLAAIVGVVGAGAFAAAVLLWALRRIPRFDLTDINRF